MTHDDVRSDVIIGVQVTPKWTLKIALIFIESTNSYY